MRLIDADAIEYRLGVDESDKQVFFVYANDIKEQPTVDPVEYLQNKGYMVKKPLQLQLYKCPHCGIQTPIRTEYCQQCFGKMDEEVTSNE